MIFPKFLLPRGINLDIVLGNAFRDFDISGEDLRGRARHVDVPCGFIIGNRKVSAEELNINGRVAEAV